VILLDLLSEVLHVDTKNSIVLIEEFNKTSLFKLVQDLMHTNVKKATKIEEMKKILGSGFGCHSIGYNDGIINFLQRLLFRYHSMSRSTTRVFKFFEESGIYNRILKMIYNIHPRSDISPKGFVSLMIFIHDSICTDFNSFAKGFYREIIIKSLCAILKEGQLKLLQTWPSSYGGGIACVNLITAQLIRIFNIPNLIL